MLLFCVCSLFVLISYIFSQRILYFQWLSVLVASLSVCESVIPPEMGRGGERIKLSLNDGRFSLFLH